MGYEVLEKRMKITGPLDVTNVTSWEELRRFSGQVTKSIVELVNGKITFSDNFDAMSISVVFPTANTTVIVPHGLNRIPAGYIVQGRSAAMIVYDSATANTTNNLYVQASAIGTANLLVY